MCVICPHEAGITNKCISAWYFVYYHCTPQRRSFGLGRPFSDNVQLENVYQLNCKIAVNIARYALNVI